MASLSLARDLVEEDDEPVEMVVVVESPRASALMRFRALLFDRGSFFLECLP